MTQTDDEKFLEQLASNCVTHHICDCKVWALREVQKQFEELHEHCVSLEMVGQRLAKDRASLTAALEEAEKAMEHIAKNDPSCSPCNRRYDYDIEEHYREKAREALRCLAKRKKGKGK